MTDSAPNGLAALDDRIVRARRTTLPPRQPRPAAAVAPATPEPEVQNQPVAEKPTAGRSQPARETSKARRAPAAAAAASGRSAELLDELAAATGTVTLGARVRQPLDQLLADLVYQTRRAGVRTTKVELIELALAQLANLDPDAVPSAVLEFRTRTHTHPAR